METAKEQLIALMGNAEDEIYHLWLQRLRRSVFCGDATDAAQSSDHIREILCDLRRVLDGKLPVATDLPGMACPHADALCAASRGGLFQGIETVLLGEVVVRDWMRRRLDVNNSEFLKLFESVNRATHKLIRYYSLRYCTACRANLHAAAQAQAISPDKPVEKQLGKSNQ